MRVLSNVKPQSRFVSKIAGRKIRVEKVQSSLEPRSAKVLIVDMQLNPLTGALEENFDTYRVVQADSIRRRYKI